MRPASKLLDCFSLHGLSDDELATAGSMAERDRSARVLMMPTHHFGEYGDLTGFRFDCSGAASGSCLPVSRRMFFGHTMVECGDAEQDILRVMSQPEKNRQVVQDFLDRVEAGCVPALLDCVPDNSDAITGHGVLQVKKKRARFLRAVDPGLRAVDPGLFFWNWLERACRRFLGARA